MGWEAMSRVSLESVILALVRLPPQKESTINLRCGMAYTV
jgi:hypothetical protein